MSKRQVFVDSLKFKKPAYVPWSWCPTGACAQRLKQYLGVEDLAEFLDDHECFVGGNAAKDKMRDPDHMVDPYGVVWNRTVDKDIGQPGDGPIKQPEDLDKFCWPEILDDAAMEQLRANLAANGDRFTLYGMGFVLYERAWTMRGMENLLMDMVERPEWVEHFLDLIVEHNLEQINRVVQLPQLDGVCFADDYGMQTGLILGLPRWRELIKPRLAKMFAPVRAAGKFIEMHSCGRVESIFDDLIEIGLNLYNPFQPELMEPARVHKQYFGRLSFRGGLSIQTTLPFGTVQDVRRETRRLIEMGKVGGYVLAPSHAVPHDVPPENLVAMVEEFKAQPGYKA